MDAEQIHPQLPDLAFFSARSGLDAVLKIPHDLRKLRSIQGKRAILKPILIQLRNQGVFCLIGCAVQFVAICQIFQNPKVCRISKKDLIFAGVFRDILNQSFIDLAPGTFDHLSRKDPLHPDMEFLHRQSAQMQPVHLHLSILGRKSLDRNPVFCDLLALILINDAQPFAFVDCLKKRFSYTVHIRLSLRIGFSLSSQSNPIKSECYFCPMQAASCISAIPFILSSAQNILSLLYIILKV